MKRAVAVLSMLFYLARAQAQETETYVLRQAVSNRETINYKRVIRFDDQKHLFHVQDYYEDGRIQMDALYTSFDKRIKEELQCNYRSNTKEGPYTEWHRNGRMRFNGHFTRGQTAGREHYLVRERAEGSRGEQAQRAIARPGQILV